MSAGDGESLFSQVFGQFLLHCQRYVERHWIEELIELRQKSYPMSFNHARRFNPVLMVGESLVWLQTRHPHINARLFGVARRIDLPQFPRARRFRSEKHHINMMVKARCSLGFDLAEGPTAHFVKLLGFTIGRRNFFVKFVLEAGMGPNYITRPFDSDAMLPLDKGLII